ncbi:MAG: bifunctional phosphopantothenoylcysteine decarboxylase/phosphopantothenate--cysteine ligase CoaBC [Proteobacteria bacterium]|nr:MAG: bifunctional phosphopantothenoylcysteine decarboxylase/phosphopantothenate--cysteine ligase CoaBC [Pseudomonadota bacterium]
MDNLASKNIIVGISGGIAAYKSAELIRLFKKAQANVRVCMTDGAKEFITPLTLQALSANPVHSTLLDPDAEAGMGHIELARWADLLVIAPATADLMARMRAGMADDLLTTLVLATQAPVHIAPAMNQQMWAHPATQGNISALAKRHHIHGPVVGEQACGDVGYGRMLEPQAIFEAVAASRGTTNNTSAKTVPSPATRIEQKFSGKKVLITAGPTREPIDPVRYLTNRSSGKMGYAIAEAAAQMGAKVVLVSGPTRLNTSDKIKRIDVETAEQMLAVVSSEVIDSDIFIAAAAVSDYRVKKIATQKLKKQSDGLNLELEQNPDILATTSLANPGLFTVGFAAETNDVIKYATGKLARKQLDMIVANQVGENKVFGKDSNQVDVLTKTGEHLALPEMDKQALAFEILNFLHELYDKEQQNA